LTRFSDKRNEWNGRERCAVVAAENLKEVPRVLLTRVEAARSLGISVDSFERYVQAELPVIRRGRLRLVRVADIEKWAADNAALTLEREGLT